MLASKVTEVPSENGEATANLLAKPNSGKRLVAFLAAKVHTAHGVRKAASQPTAPPAASYVPLTFSDSEEEGVQDSALVRDFGELINPSYPSS